MSAVLPLKLLGKSLGERHRHLNALVTDVYDQKISFETIQHCPERSSIDRLFKIDMASKCRNVEYILKTLQNEDILYVSRALKSLWLLEPQYSNFINPTYLENVLFPSMVLTAVNKMQHWLHLHLKEEERCQHFFQYYNKRNINLAMCFLSHCSSEFILCEVENILDKLTPHYMKLLGEKCPKVAKIYYDSLGHKPSYLNYYIKNERQFYQSLKFLLKFDTEMVLDIVEKYFHLYCFSKFNTQATKYIIKNCKSRCMNKIELYTVHLLDVKTLAKYLNDVELKEVVLKLARAEYIDGWFSYKSVEPFIKRLKHNDRVVFKKQVFVEKYIGDRVEKCPYDFPAAPNYEGNYERHVFTDTVYTPPELGHRKKRLIKKRKMKHSGPYELMECVDYQCAAPVVGLSGFQCRLKTYLDRLYDQYRFVGFERTFYELRKQISAESSSQNRQYILLVLVSKTGGRSEFLSQLLQLLVDGFTNEPATVRAAVVRSLVKRAAVWRVPDESWDVLLRFAHGLGLDGTEPEASCDEGLHAVVLRDIIEDKEPSIAVFEAFLNHFSTFKEYSLNNAEKSQIRDRLPHLLIPNSIENCEQAITRLSVLHEFLKTNNSNLEMHTDAMKILTALARQYPDASQALLQDLFDSHVARKQLFKENFKFIQIEASYMNALRHDITLLYNCEKFEKLIEDNALNHDNFLKKLAIYFNEDSGLASRYLTVLETRVSLKQDKTLARSIAILSDDSIWEKIHNLNNMKTKDSRIFVATLQANVHLAKPLWSLGSVEWRIAGVRAIANRVLVCSANNAEENVRRLLEWKKAAKLALVLSQRIGKEEFAFQTVVAMKPTVALKAAITYLTKHRDTVDAKVWFAVKPVITTYIDKEARCKRFDVCNKIASVIKVDYCTTIYTAFKNVSENKAIKVLCVLETMLPELDETFIYNVIEMFIRKDLTAEKVSNENKYFNKCAELYLRIIAKFLLYCKNENEQQTKMTTIAEPFMELMQKYWNTKDNTVKANITLYINDFISALRYNGAFFDNECVSVVPVFEMIIQRLHMFMPIFAYFDEYVQIHLNMLYYKSIRQAVKNYPQVFTEENRKLREGTEIVGNIFGKYISAEICELVGRYFVSVKELYNKTLKKYLNSCGYEGKHEFCKSVITGILQSKQQSTDSVAEYIFQSDLYSFNVTDKVKIIDIFKQSEDLETKFLLYAEVI